MMPFVSTFRTREIPKTESAMKRFPEVSTAIAVGESSACVAGTPSPTLVPPPATVEIMPLGETLRINLPAAMYRFPPPSRATSMQGFPRPALVAGPPSPVPG
jgi:hypothetical protein